MEPVRFPAEFSLGESDAQAAASWCSMSGAAIVVRQPLPEVSQKEAGEVLSTMMPKEELQRTNNAVMQYVAKCQELDAAMKCLEETRRAKDDECHRLELELKQTTDALHAAVKTTSDREAANARLVEINYRLNEKLNRSEASIPDFARIVKERDMEIAQLKAEKASAEQAYRAELKLVKKSVFCREKKGLKETNRNSKEVEKLLKQQKEDHAVMKVLHEQLGIKNKELKESKQLVARMSKQLRNYKANLKCSRGRRYVFSDEESGHSLNVSNDRLRTASDADDNVSYEDFADTTVATARAGFTSGFAFTSSPGLSPELTARALQDKRAAAARLPPCGHAGRNRRTGRTAEESSISDVTMSDFTVADSCSDDEDSLDRSAGRIEKEMSSTAVTAESVEASPSEVPDVDQACDGDFMKMYSTLPRGERVALKPGQELCLTASHAAVLPCARPVAQSSHVCRCGSSVRSYSSEPTHTAVPIKDDYISRNNCGNLHCGCFQIDKRHAASVAAVADAGELSSDASLSCECDRCSELTRSNKHLGNIDDGYTVTGKLLSTTLGSGVAFEPDGVRSYCLPPLFNTAVSGRAAFIGPSGDQDTFSVTSNAFDEDQCRSTPAYSKSTFPESQRGTPFAKNRTVVAESRKVRRSSAALTSAKGCRSRTKKSKAGKSVSATASDCSGYVMGESSHSDMEESSNDMDESEPPTTECIAGEHLSLKSNANVTLKIKPCSVRLIDVLAGKDMPKATSSLVVLPAPTAAARSASESCDFVADWISTAYLSSGSDTSEMACEPRVPLVLNSPASPWAVTVTCCTTTTTSISYPLATASITTVSNVTAVSTAATAAVQKCTTASSPAACTMLSHMLGDEDAAANLRLLASSGTVAARCSTAAATKVVTTWSASPAVVAIPAALPEPPLTDVVRQAASASVSARAVNTSAQVTKLGCHYVSSNAAAFFELPESVCETVAPEAAVISSTCSTLGHASTNTVQHDALRAGQSRDRLCSVVTSKLPAILPTLSLAVQSSGEKLAHSELLTGCSDPLASPASDANLVSERRTSSKPQVADAPPPGPNVGCPEELTREVLDDERARHAHAELRGGHQVPVPTDQEGGEEEGSSRRRVRASHSGSFDDDDYSGHAMIVDGADSPGGSEDGRQRAELLLAASEHDQRKTTAESCFAGGGIRNPEELGHVLGEGLHCCTSAAATAGIMRHLHPAVGENEAVFQPAESNVLQMPKGNEKHCMSNDKTNRNEEAGVSQPVALPEEEQARYAARELRIYALDTSGCIAVQDLVKNLSEVVRQPRALLEGVIEVLSESQDDLVAIVSTKCELGTYSPPTHTESESKILTLLQLASQSMANLYQSAIDILAAAIVHSSVNVSRLGRCAMCRIFAALCKATDDRARVRTIISDILISELPSFPVLIVAVASCWPDVFRCTEVEDVHWKVYERIVMQKLKADACVNVASKQVLAILQTLCNWSTEAVDPTVLCSRLTSDIVRPACPEETKRLLRLLRLVTAHEPWPWIKSSLINKLIWPLLQCWAESTSGQQPENGCVSHTVACDLIVFLGALCLDHCPQHDLCETQFVADLMSMLLEILIHSMPDVSENNQQNQLLDIPWFVQVSTFNVLLSLAPCGPELVAEAIRQWVTPYQSRIEQCVKDGVQDFLRTYLGAVSDGSR